MAQLQQTVASSTVQILMAATGIVTLLVYFTIFYSFIVFAVLLMMMVITCSALVINFSLLNYRKKELESKQAVDSMVTEIVNNMMQIRTMHLTTYFARAYNSLFKNYMIDYKRAERKYMDYASAFSVVFDFTPPIILLSMLLLLQFLTRQAFTKVRGILLVLIFLIIDQVIKALLYFAPSEISIPVIPNILSILVILNKYQTLVLQAADKFASPYIVACAKLLLLPFFLLLLYLLSKSKNRFNFKTPIGYAGVTLISSAILSTVLDSLIYKGTPDYFYLIPLYSSVDLKDVFAFLGAGCILSIISTNEKNMQKKTTNMEAK